MEITVTLTKNELRKDFYAFLVLTKGHSEEHAKKIIKDISIDKILNYKDYYQSYFKFNLPSLQEEAGEKCKFKLKVKMSTSDYV